MRLFTIFLVFIFLTSCSSKYPSERYAIAKVYRDLITSFNIGDTLKFKDDKTNLCVYLIAAIDSSFVDEGRGLMNARGRKDIVVSFHELTNPKRGYEDYDMIILNRYPDEDLASFDLRLKDFYGIDKTEPFIQNIDTVFANDLLFTNYYSFRPYNHVEQKDTNSIAKIYMTKEDGVIAYRYVNGRWWTKVK